MREIKFRGRSLASGKWVYGSLIEYGKDHISPDIYDSETMEYVAVHRESVGQSTGLLDKNGVEIFEGDIAKSHHLKLETIGEVVFSEFNAGFSIRWDRHCSNYKLTDKTLIEKARELYGIERINDHDLAATDPASIKPRPQSYMTMAWEIIGNIHESPELLEKKD